jgi:hypothetical protein
MAASVSASALAVSRAVVMPVPASAALSLDSYSA